MNQPIYQFGDDFRWAWVICSFFTRIAKECSHQYSGKGSHWWHLERTGSKLITPLLWDFSGVGYFCANISDNLSIELNILDQGLFFSFSLMLWSHFRSRLISARVLRKNLALRLRMRAASRNNPPAKICIAAIMASPASELISNFADIILMHSNTSSVYPQVNRIIPAIPKMPIFRILDCALWASSLARRARSMNIWHTAFSRVFTFVFF